MTESLYGKVVAIPVFLPGVELSIIVGLGGAYQDKFDKIMENMARQVKKYVLFDETYGNEGTFKMVLVIF